MSGNDKHSPSRQISKSRKQRPAAPTNQGPLVQYEEPGVLALQRAVARPDLARPADILALQRTVGNRAVQRLLAPRQNGETGSEDPALWRGVAGGRNRYGQARAVARRAVGRWEAYAMRRVGRDGLRGEEAASPYRKSHGHAVQRHTPAEVQNYPEHKWQGEIQFASVSGGEVGSIYNQVSEGRVRLQHDAGPQIEPGAHVDSRVSLPTDLGTWADNYEGTHDQDAATQENTEQALNAYLAEHGNEVPQDGHFLVERLRARNSAWTLFGYPQKVHVSRGKVKKPIPDITKTQLDVIYDTITTHPNDNEQYKNHVAGHVPSPYVKE